MDKPYWLLTDYNLLAFNSGNGFFWCDLGKNQGINVRYEEESKLLSEKYLANNPLGWVNLSEEEVILMCLRGNFNGK